MQIYSAGKCHKNERYAVQRQLETGSALNHGEAVEVVKYYKYLDIILGNKLKFDDTEMMTASVFLQGHL